MKSERLSRGTNERAARDEDRIGTWSGGKKLGELAFPFLPLLRTVETATIGLCRLNRRSRL